MIEIFSITSREDWLALRLKDVTSTDLAALAGHSDWKSPLQVYLEKTGKVPPVSETPAMRRGRLMEPTVVKAFAEEHPDWEIDTTPVYVRDTELRFGCSPDGFVTTDEGKCILECKTVADYVFEDWNGLPKEYLFQVQSQLFLTQLDRAYVPVIVIDGRRNLDYHEFIVDRDPRMEEPIRHLVTRFWQDIDLGIEPEPDYSRDLDLIKLRRPPQDGGAPLDWRGNNRIAEIVANREQLDSAKKEIDGKIKAINAEIIHDLDGAARAELSGWRISYKTVTIPEHMVKESTYPRLDIRRTKETRP